MKTFSWLSQKLEVKETASYGSGVYAVEFIKKGERLAIFGGHILTLEEEQSLSEEFRDTGLQIAENFVISTMDKKEDNDCFNHSCNPNCGFRGQIFLVAMRDLEVNDQACFDYAMVLSGDDSEYKLKCECGEDSCRGYITQFDWKKPELQIKYEGYFQSYLEEKIKNNT